VRTDHTITWPTGAGVSERRKRPDQAQVNREVCGFIDGAGPVGWIPTTTGPLCTIELIGGKHREIRIYLLGERDEILVRVDDGDPFTLCLAAELAQRLAKHGRGTLSTYADGEKVYEDRS